WSSDVCSSDLQRILGNRLVVLTENNNLGMPGVILAGVNMCKVSHFFSPYTPRRLFLSVVVFADDLLSVFLATIGPPFVRGAARPFLGALAAGQPAASAEYIYCRVQREHIKRMTSTPFILKRAIAQYRGHNV